MIKPVVGYDDFEKIDIRIGTVTAAQVNAKARKPAYVLEIDFGELGIKKTSAQITDAYPLDKLHGIQVAAVVNFPPKQVADVISEVLILGIVAHGAPTILLTPSTPVANGRKVA